MEDNYEEDPVDSDMEDNYQWQKRTTRRTRRTLRTIMKKHLGLLMSLSLVPFMFVKVSECRCCMCFSGYCYFKNSKIRQSHTRDLRNFKCELQSVFPGRPIFSPSQPSEESYVFSGTLAHWRISQIPGQVRTWLTDAERLAMALALETEHPLQPLALASDSMAALCTLRDLAKGAPPRSGIEKRLKNALTKERTVGALWVRSHIGIPGNERADRRAALEGIRGQGDSPELVTWEGLREKDKAWRETLRTAPGYGRHRTTWGKHALAAYTWTRTNRGPQREWLHHIGKGEDPSCPCGHPSQDGDHLVFHCPLLREQRGHLLPEEKTWESLDDPHWVTEAGGNGRKQEKIEGTEAFFQDLYWFFKRRNTGVEGELE